jgi:hypothetical protein
LEYFYDNSYTSDNDEVDNSLALVKYVSPPNTSYSTDGMFNLTADSLLASGSVIEATSKSVSNLLTQLQAEKS